jgi:hypothetical protein
MPHLVALTSARLIRAVCFATAAASPHTIYLCWESHLLADYTLYSGTYTTLQIISCLICSAVNLAITQACMVNPQHMHRTTLLVSCYRHPCLPGNTRQGACFISFHRENGLTLCLSDVLAKFTVSGQAMSMVDCHGSVGHI